MSLEKTPFRDPDVSPSHEDGASHEFGPNKGIAPQLERVSAHAKSSAATVESRIVKKYLTDSVLSAFHLDLAYAAVVKNGLFFPKDPVVDRTIFLKEVARQYRNQIIPNLIAKAYSHVLGHIIAAVIEHHNPTIDFRLLQKLSSDAVKARFPELFHVEPKPVSIEPSIEVVRVGATVEEAIKYVEEIDLD